MKKRAAAVLKGQYHDQFLVDWYQGGAGTSTNMNANEVLANIALEMTGHKKGDYSIIDPHDDLNMSQSTNDSYPTAIKVALIMRNDKLIAELEKLAAAFREKGDAYIDIVKMGRTEMQDAVPMTVGQEFHAFAASLETEIAVLREAEKHLYAVNMGATAIGTGINAPKGYAEKYRGTSCQADRQTDRAGHRHARGDVGPGRIRRLFIRVEERGREALENFERFDPPHFRSASRSCRNQPARVATRFVDHAGQG